MLHLLLFSWSEIAEQSTLSFTSFATIVGFLLLLMIAVGATDANSLLDCFDHRRAAPTIRLRRTYLSLPIALIALLLVTSSVALAQADAANATVKGEVIDQTGAAVSGAVISISNLERGTTRNVLTDDEGIYRIPFLQPGLYDLRIEAKGFQSQVLRQMVLTVGEVGVYDVQLQISEIKEAVRVDNPTPEIERTQQSETIERQQVANLPNLSRNLTSYVFTLPGIADVSAARVQQTRVAPIPTSGFSVGAGNGRSNYFSIDGGENDSGVGSLRVRNLSVEAVQEFQINRNAFSAEYGFTAGTAVNVVTRGGTNEFHGAGYLFYRSQKTSARDPLNTTGHKAFEQRIVPGFNLSGPISRNRAFFFSSFEALKYDVARLRSYTSNAALLQPTNAQEVYLRALETGPNATDITRRIASGLRSTLTTTNYPTTMELLRGSEGQFTAPSRSYNWTTRLDFEPTLRDVINGRFTLAKEDNNQLRADNVEAPTNALLEVMNDYTVVGTWGHIFGGSLVNQLRVQFASDHYRQISAAPDSALIRIAGLIDYGRVLTIPTVMRQKRYQFDDVVSWIRGTQDFKFGISYRPVDANLLNELGFGGTYQFAAGLPLSRAIAPADLGVLIGPLTPSADSTLTSIQAFNLGLPSIWQQGFGQPGFHAWQHNLGTFGQVSHRLTPRLTINVGARLNFDGEPEPLDRNVSISPRVGFAWDPFGKGKTVIRGGFGTFFAPVSLQVLSAATLQSDSGEFINLQSRTLQDGAQSTQALWAYGVSIGRLPFLALREGDVRAFGIIPAPQQPNRRISEAAEDYDNPYTVQASLGISQEIARDLGFEIAVQVYHGVHLPIAIERNYRESGQFVTVPGMPGSDLFGPRLERIDPLLAQKIVHSSEGNSIYYGMTSSLFKRFGKSQFRASYTYSKAIDDVLDFTGASTPYLPTRRRVDRGISAYDLRHSFVFSGVFETKSKSDGQSRLQQTLSDITLSPIIALRSGFPFNLFIGRDVNGDLNSTDRPYHAPRNSGVGENFYSVDLRVSKRIYFGEDTSGPRVELIAEATNLFNRANFLRVNDVVCGTTAQPGFINGCDPKFLFGPFDFRGDRSLPPTAPLGFVTAAPARQFQFGLKFEF